MSQANSRIIEYAKSLGIDEIGFCAPIISKEDAEAMKSFIANQYHGNMKWLESHLVKKVNPKLVMSDAQSVIVFGVNYYHSNGNGLIAKYALSSKDYHLWIKKTLKQISQFIYQEYQAHSRPFVDTAPIMEKALAREAGVGWQGKHSCVVSRSQGSWMLLGIILTEYPFEYSEPHRNFCGKCTKCIDACPTDAIVSPYVVDSRKCIAYHTIENTNAYIPDELSTKFGSNIFGCDICINACPWNKFTKQAQNKNTEPQNKLANITIEGILSMNEEGFNSYFAQTPIKRTGYASMLRNALIAAYNAPKESYLKYIKLLTIHNNPLVAHYAKRAYWHSLKCIPSSS